MGKRSQAHFDKTYVARSNKNLGRQASSVPQVNYGTFTWALNRGRRVICKFLGKPRDFFFVGSNPFLFLLRVLTPPGGSMT